MEIQINNYPIQFEIEGEKNLSDVMNSLNSWAMERDLVLTEARINDSNYIIDQIPDLPLNSVSLINCFVQSRSDIVISSLYEAIAYTDRIRNFMDKILDGDSPDPGEMEHLAPGVEWLIEITGKITDMLGIKTSDIRHRDHSAEEILVTLRRFATQTSAGNSDHAGLFKSHTPLFQNLKDIFKIILMSDHMRDLTVRSIDSPDVLLHSLKDTKEGLQAQLANLENTAVAYQTGKDVQGSENIQNFIDFIYRYIRTCHQIVPVFGIELSAIIIEGTDMAEKNRSIQALLGEIVSVLEANDIISLSDILEYELKPNLENLDAYIVELLKKLGESDSAAAL